MPFREIEAWRKLVEDYRSLQARSWQRTVLANLLGREVRDLVDACRHGSWEEQMAAVGLLMRLSAARDQRLTAQLRAEWVAWLEETVRRDYPTSPVSIRSFQAWRERDKAAAEAFLVDELPMARARDPDGARYVVMQLASFAAFGSAAALRRLEALEDLPAEAARERERALASFRPITTKEVERLAEGWRRTQSPDALYRIYSRYIAGLPVGEVKLDELVALLGPPTERRGNDLWYQPTDGTQLYLEGDAQGRLTGRRWS